MTFGEISGLMNKLEQSMSSVIYEVNKVVEHKETVMYMFGNPDEEHD